MKVAIIGGGACGLVLANQLEEAGIDYELFEKSLCGRKILASGNGRANIGNTHLDDDCYNQPFAYELVKNYYDKLMAFYQKINLTIKCDSEGRIYPYSESSLTVFQCLLRKKLKIVENMPIERISRINHQYYLNDVRGPFDRIVLASGSMASFTPKKQEGFLSYLDSFDLTIKPLKPSLVGFQCYANWGRISGVRVKCRAKLYHNEELIHAEDGEVIFKKDGLSGICIMNLSSYYQRLSEKNNCFIHLDLIPDLKLSSINQEQLMGILPPKLYEYVLSQTKDYLSYIKDFKAEIKEPYDFEFAQVVSGGIALDEIDEHLALKNNPHIYVGGELLDVDGVCGGYNLMFAFSCGLKIGEELCNIK